MQSVMEHNLHNPRMRFSQWFQKEHGSRVNVVHLDNVEREYKRWMFICGSQPDDTPVGVGRAELVDEFWHQHLLFSREYTDFCDEHFGRYIHHQPCGDGFKNVPAELDGLEPFEMFLEEYKKEFGQDAPEEYWPRFSVPPVDSCGGGSGGGGKCSQCSSCNKGGNGR